MSGCKDIRSYFAVGASKNQKNVKNSLEDDDFMPKIKKKRAIVISDSDDDEPSLLPAKRQKSPKKQENQKIASKKFEPLESKPAEKVSPADVYGTAKVKRVTGKSTSQTDRQDLENTKTGKLSDSKKCIETELKNKNDKDAEKHVKVTEERSKYFTKEEIPKKEKNKITSESQNSPGSKSKMKDRVKKFQADDKSSEVIAKGKHQPSAETAEKRKGEKRKATESGFGSAKKQQVQFETAPDEKVDKSEKHSSDGSTANHLPKPEPKNKDISLETSTNTKSSRHHREDLKSGKDDRHSIPISNAASSSVEKSKEKAYNYQRYLQREGPKHHGTKVLPKGKPNCLAKMVFVVTGMLDSMNREEAVALIQEHGGKVTSNVSRNTSYLVVGEEAGPSKLAKAKSCNTPQIDEDGLLDLIKEKSGIPKGQAEVSDDKKTDEAEVDSKNSKIRIEDNSHKASLVESKPHIKKIEHVAGDDHSTPRSSSSVGETNTSRADTRLCAMESLLWVDKYRPVSTKNVIGQQGDRSNLKKLQRWLADWHSNHSGHKKLVRPSPWAKDDSGAFFKAALLSGAPGVGKTTTAHLVCKELGFDVVEFNASDTRSKRLLHEEVQELLRNKSLFGYFKSGVNTKPTEKHVLLMDEVDGMAGNEDRGGVQELIQLIKNTKVPIICMCNDRHHPKIRSLVNYCFDLGFSKPRVDQIKGAMMSICYKEGVKISPEALTDVITAANQDIRQVLHHLSVFSANSKNMSTEQTKKDANDSRKILKLGPWDVVRKVFSATEHKNMSLMDRMDLFFQDYSIGPLFVQENYLSVVPHAAKSNPVRTLECVAKAVESLTLGDVVEKSIRSNNNWSMLPVQAVFSSVVPGDCMEGHLTGQINFPAWLGKNSRAQKFNRLMQELQCHMRLSITGDKQAVGLEYAQLLRQAVASPLAKQGTDGVDEAVQVLQAYNLTREDLDSILELTAWPGKPDPMAKVDSKVKAAFTRKYNKEVAMLPYAVESVKKVAAKAATLAAGEEMDVEDETEESQENEDDVTTDSMIKAKKRPLGKQKEPKDEKAARPSSAKKARGKGRGR